MYTQRQHHLSANFQAKRPVTSDGQALAVLQAPSIDLNLMVVEGDSPDDLRGGPGHAPSTPKPGDAGNSVILGHRDRYGGPFGKLDALHPGDEIYVHVKGRPVTAFRVTSSTVVTDGNARALAPTGGSRLTLVTSAGSRLSGDHLVVVAERIGTAPKATASRPPPKAASFEPSKGGLLLAPPMLVAYIGVVVIALGWSVLRRRASLVPAIVALSPVVVAVLVALLLELDHFLPATL
jgi:LPXTG-site transpeptidase (sortase) family protein